MANHAEVKDMGSIRLRESRARVDDKNRIGKVKRIREILGTRVIA